MAAAQYWRIKGLVAYGGGDVSLSSLHLYSSGTRIDTSATLTSTIAPTSGALANLSDTDSATLATWTAVQAAAPGYALVWDFGGSPQDVTDILIGAASSKTTFPYCLTIESSSDAVTWSSVNSINAVLYPGASTQQTVTIGSSGDPNYSSVSLLLHCNGTNGSTTFTDGGPNPKTVTANGNAQISTAQSKFGGASGYFDGSGDYLQIPSSTDFDFGTSDFTIEAWIRPSAFSADRVIFSRYSTWASVLGFYLGTRAGSPNIIIFRAGNTSPISLNGNTAVVVDTWVHVAVARASGVTRMFVGGVLQTATHTGSVDITSGAALRIGINNEGTEAFNGYIDDVRITNGVARYTADFTPPTVEFPSVSGISVDPNYSSVSLLLNCNGANGSTTFTDSSSSPKTVTANGGAQISTAQSKYGGASGYFDGSGDYLSVPTSTEFNMGSSTPFTIEFWMYVVAHSTGYPTLIARASDGTTYPGQQWSLAMNPNGAGLNFNVSNGSAWINPGPVGSASISANAWHHVALVRVDGTATGMKIYLDGSLHATSTAAANLEANATSKQLVISGYQTSQGFNGYIDDVRITKGVARYTADFTPPTVEFGNTTTGGTTTPLIATDFAAGMQSIGYSIAGATGMSTAVAKQASIDVYDGGTGVVVGTVKQKALPSNTPLARRVCLFHEPSKRLIRETWSTANGDYTFTGLAKGVAYTIVAYDHLQAYRAVISDNVQAT